MGGLVSAVVDGVKAVGKAIVKAVDTIVDAVVDVVKSDIFKIFIKTFAAIVATIACGGNIACGAAAYAAVGALYGETSIEEVGMNLLAGALVGASGPVPGADFAWNAAAMTYSYTSSTVLATAVYAGTIAAALTIVQVAVGEIMKQVFALLPEGLSTEAKIGITTIASIFVTRAVQGNYSGADYQSGTSTAVMRNSTTATQTNMGLWDMAKNVISTTDAWSLLGNVSKATALALQDATEKTQEILAQVRMEIDAIRRQMDELLEGLEDSIMITQQQAANNFPILAGGSIYNSKLAGGLLYSGSGTYHPEQLLFGGVSDVWQSHDDAINLPFEIGYAGTPSYSTGNTV